MTGVYPTLSYPSWTSLVTGQYPETHGVVGNFIYDPVDKDTFSIFDEVGNGKKKVRLKEYSFFYYLGTTANNLNKLSKTVQIQVR